MPSQTANWSVASNRRTAAPLIPADSTFLASAAGSLAPSFRYVRCSVTAFPSAPWMQASIAGISASLRDLPAASFS